MPVYGGRRVPVLSVINHVTPVSLSDTQVCKLMCANMCEGIRCLIWFDGTLILASFVFEYHMCPLMSSQQKQCKYKYLGLLFGKKILSIKLQETVSVADIVLWAALYPVLSDSSVTLGK